MDYSSQLVYALLLAIPVACIVWTVTQEEVFKELRQALNAFQKRARSLWQRKLGYVPTCPYCFSHYVAGLFVWLFHFKMLAEDWRGYVVSLFTIVLLANTYITTYNLLRATLRRVKALADQAEANEERAKLATSAKGPRNKPWLPALPSRKGHRVQNLVPGRQQMN